MYNKIEGGSSINIQGLECQIPPVGKVFNAFSGLVEPRHVYKRSNKESEQYWEIDKPENIKLKLRREYKKRLTNKNYFDPDLQEYRDREWDRRINGFWFMNNGVPTYITGLNYFFLSHWTIEGNFPHYRDTDRLYFYFFEYCWNDPNSFGMLEVTQRRAGKSVKAGCVLYERTSRAFNKKSGIQSKTDLDAERLFSKQVVNPWKKLEQLFKPTTDKKKTSTPKKVLSFNLTSTTSTKEANVEDMPLVEELESEIDYRASTESAYDGDKLYVYVSDECGKSDKANIYVRHSIVKPCMTVGTSIIGKMIYTTTVEDIGDSDMYEEGNFQKLWDESDPLKVDEVTKRTTSGLYRYFLPADHALSFDKYGFPKVQENRAYLLGERATLSGSPSAQAKLIRKYPLTIDEAFMTPGEECIYDVVKIDSQKKVLNQIDNKDLFYRGNLAWRGERGTEVMFLPNPNGRFKFNKKFDIYAECKKVNSKIDYDGNIKPLMKHLRTIGIDPFDHKVVSTEHNYKGSQAAASAYFKYNPMDELSETFTSLYLHRPEDLDEFHEDMCLLAFLLGAEVAIENNKQLLIKYMIDSGFNKFLYYHGSTPGIPANSKTHSLLANTTEIYINENIEKVPFVELIDDWSKFNLKKTTKFDAAMSAGWALVGGYSERIRTKMKVKEVSTPIYEADGFY